MMVLKPCNYKVFQTEISYFARLKLPYGKMWVDFTFGGCLSDGSAQMVVIGISGKLYINCPAVLMKRL